MNISNYLRNKLLDKAVGGADFTPAANLFVRAFSTVLTAAGAGTEISNAGYAAIEVPNNFTNFPAAVNGAKSNALRLDGDAATENFADILAFGLFDAASGGNLYFYDNLDAPLAIENGQNFFFDAGDISFLFQ